MVRNVFFLVGVMFSVAILASDLQDDISLSTLDKLDFADLEFCENDDTDLGSSKDFDEYNYNEEKSRHGIAINVKEEVLREVLELNATLLHIFCAHHERAKIPKSMLALIENAWKKNPGLANMKRADGQDAFNLLLLNKSLDDDTVVKILKILDKYQYVYDQQNLNDWLVKLKKELRPETRKHLQTQLDLLRAKNAIALPAQSTGLVISPPIISEEVAAQALQISASGFQAARVKNPVVVMQQPADSQEPATQAAQF